MKTRDDIDVLEKLIVQFKSFHYEISQLAKKAPNDGLNMFKLGLVNKSIERANRILQGGYKPVDGFDVFDMDQLPSNSDVTLILSQYIEQIERFRSNNVVLAKYKWWYLLDGEQSEVLAAPPTRVGGCDK